MYLLSWFNFRQNLINRPLYWSKNPINYECHWGQIIKFNIRRGTWKTYWVKIKVNDKIAISLNHQLYIHDVVTFEEDVIPVFLKNLEWKIRNHKILFNYPKYLEFCSLIMKCMLISYPTRKNIPTTWDFNLSFLQNF
jgi:hypothetical protein